MFFHENLKFQYQEMLLLLAIIFLTIYYYSRRARRGNVDLDWLKQFPHPSPVLPIVGNIYEVAGSPTSKLGANNVQQFAMSFKYSSVVDVERTFARWVEKFGGIFYIWWLSNPIVILTDPTIIRVVNMIQYKRNLFLMCWKCYI
jgi:hypothetical protein